MRISLLIGEFKNSEAVQKNMENRLASGKINYDITDESTITCNGQSYITITYNFKNEENPYSHGISAFGIFENLAICGTDMQRGLSGRCPGDADRFFEQLYLRPSLGAADR